MNTQISLLRTPSGSGWIVLYGGAAVCLLMLGLAWNDTCVGQGLVALSAVLGGVGCVWQARHLVRLRERLQDREARLQLALNTSGLGLWDYHADSEQVGSDAYTARLLGYPPEEFSETRSAFVARLHPQDRPRVRAAFRDYLAGTLPEYDVTLRMRVRSGAYRWFRSTGQIMSRDAQGRAVRAVGTYQDITEQKANILKLSQLSARLLSVQEHERRTLAGELHDQIGQQLTALKLNLHALRSAAQAAGQDARWQDCSEIVTTTLAQVRQQVFDLRPPVLDELGLGPALDEYCRKQEERSATCITVDGTATLGALPETVALVAFRVVQEAVNNALRHAAPECISVQLQRDAETLWVKVEDNGSGMTQACAAAPSSEGGMGLLTMRERVLSVQGEVQIETALSGGVRISVRLPLSMSTVTAATAPSLEGNTRARAEAYLGGSE